MSDGPDDNRQLFNPFATKEVSPPFTEHWEASRRVAQAIRDLTDVLVTSTPPAAELHAMAEKLEAQTREFARSKRLHGILEFLADGNLGDHGQINHELNGVGGWSNPLSPGLNMWIEGNKAFGHVNCGFAYEGPPGCIHGGHIAAIFDQFLGMAQLAGKNPGMTGTLTLRYLRPTPLNTDLDLSAQITLVEGKRTVVKGKMMNGDTVTATCEGLFIRPRSRPTP